MNKSHITDEQVKIVLQMYWHADNPSKIFSNVDIQDMRRSLEAAFPEQQPAAFGPLVVTEEMARELWHEFQKPIGWAESTEFLQSFVDAHSIKPIEFADRMPEDGIDVFIWHNEYKQWVFLSVYNGYEIQEGFTHWFPASALPIPDPAVDSMEVAWKRFIEKYACHDEEATFKAGYEAGQAGGKQP